MDEVRRVLVVNADDFGYCEQRNKGVIECFQKGAISSASIMVNAQATVQAFELAKQHGMPIGLHFNVTEGVPLSPVSEVGSLVGPDGFFLGMHGFPDALSRQAIKLNEVASELKSQVDAFRAATGHDPAHVDGHQHVHVLPGVAEIFANLLAKIGIKYTRLPLEHGIDDCQWLEGTAWQASFTTVVQNAKMASTIFRKAGIQFTDGFVGMVTMGSNMELQMTATRLLHRLQLCFTQLETSKPSPSSNPTDTCNTDTLGTKSKSNMRTISCELMVHPGYPSIKGRGGVGQGPDEFSCSPDRLNEIKVLTCNEMRKFFIEYDIALCKFADLI